VAGGFASIRAHVVMESSTVDLNLASAQDLVLELSQRVQALAEKEAKVKCLERRFHELTNEKDEVVEINAGGEFHSVGRGTLCLAKDSLFAAMFSGAWDQGQKRDSAGRVFLDIDPYIFRVIVNFLRQKRIESPDARVPSPIISNDKLDAWHRSVEYYGLSDFICPENLLKVQSLTRAGKLCRTKLDMPRGYLVRISNAVKVKAVLAGLDGDVSGVSISVGRGNFDICREVEVRPFHRSTCSFHADEDVTHVADGFSETLHPPEFFVMVKPNSAHSGKYRYVEGDHAAHSVGDLSVSSKGGFPLYKNLFSIVLTLVYEAA